jgi:hypothetical protein
MRRSSALATSSGVEAARPVPTHSNAQPMTATKRAAASHVWKFRRQVIGFPNAPSPTRRVRSVPALRATARQAAIAWLGTQGATRRVRMGLPHGAMPWTHLPLRVHALPLPEPNFFGAMEIVRFETASSIQNVAIFPAPTKRIEVNGAAGCARQYRRGALIEVRACHVRLADCRSPSAMSCRE